jgi:hypothetical protein
VVDAPGHPAETRIQGDSPALYLISTDESEQGINSDVSGNLSGRTWNFSAMQSTAKSAENIAIYGSTAAPYSKS